MATPEVEIAHPTSAFSPASSLERPASAGPDILSRRQKNKRRQEFTFCSHSDGEYSPKILNSNLADLEMAEGLVSLSSGTTSPTPRSPPRRRVGPVIFGQRPYSASDSLITTDNDKNFTDSETNFISGSENNVNKNGVAHMSRTMKRIDNFRGDTGNYPIYVPGINVPTTDSESMITVETDNGSTSSNIPTNDSIMSQCGSDRSSQQVGFSDKSVQTETFSSGSSSKEDIGFEEIESKDSGREGSDMNDIENGGAIEEDEDRESQAPTLKVEYVGKVWDAYINDFLLGSEHIKDAAIYDQATRAIISASAGFMMHEKEFNQLLQCLSCLLLAYRVGVTVNGCHYKTVLADGRFGIMAKGEHQDGCSACQTRTLVIVAVHDRTGKARRCNEELMRLGDFFWAKGL